MESDRPWTAPTEHVIVGRRWTYAPPPRFLYEAIADDMARWLSPQTGETVPKVTASRRPDAVDIEIDSHDQTGRPLHVDVTAFLLARGADPTRAYNGIPVIAAAEARGHWLAAEVMRAWTGRGSQP